MLMLAGALAILLAAALTGRDLRRLATVELRSTWVLYLVLLLQVLVLGVLARLPGAPVAAGHVLSYVLIGAFAFLNRAVPGLIVMATGAALNGVTIALNGGTLPASPAARARAGFGEISGQFVNSGVVADPKLAFLGDIFAVPAGWPFANTFSIGDAVLFVGMAVCVATVCHVPRLRPPGSVSTGGAVA